MLLQQMHDQRLHHSSFVALLFPDLCCHASEASLLLAAAQTTCGTNCNDHVLQHDAIHMYDIATYHLHHQHQNQRCYDAANACCCCLASEAPSHSRTTLRLHNDLTYELQIALCVFSLFSQRAGEG